LGELTVQICFGLGFQSYGARQFRLGLFEIRFKRARINREEQLALLHVCAIGEMNSRNATGNLGLDRDDFARTSLSDGIQMSWHVLTGRRRYFDGSRRTLEDLLGRTSATK